jgi:hypothetical protein
VWPEAERGGFSTSISLTVEQAASSSHCLLEAQSISVPSDLPVASSDAFIALRIFCHLLFDMLPPLEHGFQNYLTRHNN